MKFWFYVDSHGSRICFSPLISSVPFLNTFIFSVTFKNKNLLCEFSSLSHFRSNFSPFVSVANVLLVFPSSTFTNRIAKKFSTRFGHKYHRQQFIDSFITIPFVSLGILLKLIWSLEFLAQEISFHFY